MVNVSADLDTIERTIAHELYHIAANPGREAGARMFEVIHLLNRLSRKASKRERMPTLVKDVYSWFLRALSHYSPEKWHLWEALAVKQGVRKFGPAAYEIYRGRDMDALVRTVLRAGINATRDTLFYLYTENPSFFTDLVSAGTWLSREERRELAKKLWLAAKSTLRVLNENRIRPNEYILRFVTGLVVAKQLIEGNRKRVQDKELYALANSVAFPQKEKERLIRIGKRLFWEEAKRHVNRPLQNDLLPFIRMAGMMRGLHAEGG